MWLLMPLTGILVNLLLQVGAEIDRFYCGTLSTILIPTERYPRRKKETTILINRRLGLKLWMKLKLPTVKMLLLWN